MATVSAAAGAPSPDDVRRICALQDPFLRNLEITYCYYRLSLAFTARTGLCANWCTFATWASRQAGRTIRGEDFIEALTKNTITGSVFSHPIRALWRSLLRKGLLNPQTLVGRVVRAIHSPFDALERASDAVARGNLKVFEEIGLEFARHLQVRDSSELERFIEDLSAGDPPDGQDYLKAAFLHYQRQAVEPDPALRAQWIFMANLEIGLHEQTRLQPEIRQALEAAPETAEDLGVRTLQAIYPGAWNWKAFVRRPLAAALAPAARSFSSYVRELTRRVITDSLMMLALPGVTIALGRHLDRVPSAALTELTDPQLLDLLKRFEAPAQQLDDCGAEDWSDLVQRMHFIVHLFRAFHDCEDLLESPFTAGQLSSLGSGVLPEGRL